MARLPTPPDLDWRDGAPISRAFDDVYASTAGALAQSETVFLSGCGLPGAWRGRDAFAILELGFGTGLNALAVWRRWRETRAPGARLHFVSIEAHPLTREDAARALTREMEVAPLAERLLVHWPVRAFGAQRVWFEDDGFALTVIIDDALRALGGLDGAFDAFFLDGFAPAKNPTMWSSEVFARLRALAAPGARASTYTVAGDVRRALEANGFASEKQPGFAHKRERLEARLVAPIAKPHPLYPRRGGSPKRVAVVGAGIAGACVAQALARRGADVAIYDKALGAGASGNPAALVMPRLDRGEEGLQRFHVSAFVHAVRTYEALGVFNACRALERTRADVLADPPLPPDWLSAENDDVVHRYAGVVRPADVIAAMTRGATLKLGARVARVDRDSAWILRGADGAELGRADAVVLANGAALGAFEQSAFLPLRFTAGQIEWGAGAIDRAVVDDGYVAPCAEGVVFGATFERVDAPVAAITDAARAENWERLKRLAPELRVGELISRASIRTATPDYAPIAGALPDAEAWTSRFAGIAQGRQPDLSTPAPAHEGLYALGALSARGFTLAPMLAEDLVSAMFDEPRLLTEKEQALVHPARFLFRALRRGG